MLTLKQKLVAQLVGNGYGTYNQASFDMEAAIYWFASDWHNGQASELYSVLSTSQYHPSPLHRGASDEGELCAMMYESLVLLNPALTVAPHYSH